MDDNYTQDLVVGLDIGTTKIAAVAGYKNANGQIDVVGYGSTPSTGVENGQIINIVKTVDGIVSSMKDLNRRGNIQVNEVFVGIAGYHIRSYKNTLHLFRNGNKEPITQQELDEMRERMRNANIPAGEDVIDVIPQCYNIDNTRQSINPAGELGNEVVGIYQIITGESSEINKISMCTERANLKIREIILEPIASALSCLTEDEKQQGVLLVDIGGGTTDLIIYYQGNPVYTNVVALGGDSVTNDIASMCGLSTDMAEQIKIKYGSCIVNQTDVNNTITVSRRNGASTFQVSQNYLSQVINLRISGDILRAIKEIVERSGYQKILKSMVLTGGGALLHNIRELCNYEIGLPTRIATPDRDFVRDIVPTLKSPCYSTVLGLLKYGIEAQGEVYAPDQTPDPDYEYDPHPDEHKTSDLWGLLRKVGDYFKRMLDQVS